MTASKEWGIRPSELGLCAPEDDLSVMIAYLGVRAKMGNWEYEQNKNG